jgi:hypothetical protein
MGESAQGIFFGEGVPGILSLAGDGEAVDETRPGNAHACPDAALLVDMHGEEMQVRILYRRVGPVSVRRIGAACASALALDTETPLPRHLGNANEPVVDVLCRLALWAEITMVTMLGTPRTAELMLITGM